MARGPRRFHRWKWLRRSTAVLFLVLLVLGARDDFHWFRGSTTGTRLFEVIPLSDPLAALEITLSSRTLHWTMLTGAAILVGACLLLGPVFCGWVCPLGLLLDVNDGIRRRLRRLFAPRKAGKKAERGPRVPRATRYGILGLVLGFSLVAGVPAFQIISPINLVSWSAVFFAAQSPSAVASSTESHDSTAETLTVVSPTDESQASGVAQPAEAPPLRRAWNRVVLGAQAIRHAAGPLLWLLLALIVLEYFLPRLWCRALCPLGALYSTLGRFALLRVRINPQQRGKARCEHCAYDCPMGIEVMRDYTLAGKPAIDDLECTRCGECIDTCPRGVLQLGFRDKFPPAEGCPTCGADAAGTQASSASVGDKPHNPLHVIQSPPAETPREPHAP